MFMSPLIWLTGSAIIKQIGRQMGTRLTLGVTGLFLCPLSEGIFSFKLFFVFIIFMFAVMSAITMQECTTISARCQDKGLFSTREGGGVIFLCLKGFKMVSSSTNQMNVIGSLGAADFEEINPNGIPWYDWIGGESMDLEWWRSSSVSLNL